MFNITSENGTLPANVTVHKVLKTVVKKPSWIEYLLIYWMMGFAAEEARQVAFKLTF